MSSEPDQHRKRTRDPEQTRVALVQACIGLILERGFCATSVADICAAAGVTKGSFFHHFESKEAIGAAAIETWGRHGASVFAAAWDDDQSDPLERLGCAFDIMIGFTRSETSCNCVVGIMSQEVSLSHDDLRAGAARELGSWSERTAALITAAKEKHCAMADFDPEELAWYLNSQWQGSMLVAKARQDPALIRRNLEFSRRWLANHFPAEVRHLLEPDFSPPNTKSK